jgi:hypothetical protein
MKSKTPHHLRKSAAKFALAGQQKHYSRKLSRAVFAQAKKENRK